jgi:hypothetical protein
MEKVIKMSPVIQALLLTALFVGGAIWRQKQPHTSIVSAWLQLNSKFVPKVIFFMEPSDYDVVVCHRYGSGGGGGTTDPKVVAMQESICSFVRPPHSYSQQ